MRLKNHTGRPVRLRGHGRIAAGETATVPDGAPARALVKAGGAREVKAASPRQPASAPKPPPPGVPVADADRKENR